MTTQTPAQQKIITPYRVLSLGLFFLFLTLKLAGIGIVASWSWIWITSPLWFGWALVAACLLLGCLALAVQGIYNLLSGQTYSGPVGSKGSWRDFFG